MTVAIILGIMMVTFLVVTIVAMVAGDEEVVIGGLVLTVIFMFAMIIVGSFELNEVRTACETYCTEQGYSYDSIKTEGEEQYCVCDTGLERHLIKQNTEVIIE